MSATWPDARDLGTARHHFVCELEFVQCLANPDYLHWLAKEQRFQDPSFLLFLRYLRSYWTKPEYASYLQYPQCLRMLEACVTSEAFRNKLKEPGAIEELKRQQACSWIYYDRHEEDFQALLQSMM